MDEKLSETKKTCTHPSVIAIWRHDMCVVHLPPDGYSEEIEKPISVFCNACGEYLDWLSGETSID